MQHPDMNELGPDEIAARLQQDRADLAGSIEGLRDRLSLDAVLDDALGYAVANAAPYARALDGAVRANPIAAVMVGVGLAWLVLGRKSPAPPQAPPEPPLAGTRFEAMARWEDEGGPVAPLPEPDQAWVVEADRLRDRASAALHRIDAAARQRLRPAADMALERAEVLTDLAKATRAAMLQGLETLGSDAQDRIVAAREQAYAARIAVARRGTKLIEEKPLVAGAIGMALGAVVGAILPRTSAEDRIFGPERDELLAQARLALRQERARADERARAEAAR